MKHIIIAAALLATPAAADPLSEASDAMTICQTAKEQEAREDALDRIMQAGRDLVLLINPLTLQGRIHTDELELVTTWARQCIAITYPD